MDKKSASRVWMWRRNMTYETLILALTLFELILSMIFISVSYLMGNLYFKGVGIGLVIAWVTSAAAYLVVRKAKAARPSV